MKANHQKQIPSIPVIVLRQVAKPKSQLSYTFTFNSIPVSSKAIPWF